MFIHSPSSTAYDTGRATFSSQLRAVFSSSKTLPCRIRMARSLVHISSKVHDSLKKFWRYHWEHNCIYIYNFQYSIQIQYTIQISNLYWIQNSIQISIYNTQYLSIHIYTQILPGSFLIKLISMRQGGKTKETSKSGGTHVIPARGKWWPDDQKFKGSLLYTVNSRPS